MMLNKVDLPQPEGPITPTNSPGATERETPSTAVTTPSGVSNRLVMLSTTRMPSGTVAGLDAADSTVAAAMLVPWMALLSGLAGHIAHQRCLAQRAPRAKRRCRAFSPARHGTAGRRAGTSSPRPG